MGVFDDLDDASEARIQALLGQQMRGAGPRVHRDTQVAVKIRKSKKRGNKSLTWEGESENLNETVSVTIELPRYMVAALHLMAGEDAGDSKGRIDEVVREAVRDKIKREGLDLIFMPRFAIAMVGEVKRARDRFTRTFG